MAYLCLVKLLCLDLTDSAGVSFLQYYARISNNELLLCCTLHNTVLDARQAVKQQVRDKIDKTDMPKPFKDAAKKIGAKAASKLATPSTVAMKMGQEMPKKMPQEMSEKGLTVHAEMVFQEGTCLFGGYVF